jgi:hypothetical protein
LVIPSTTVPADFHYSSFVHIFINSFSIGLTLRAKRYKISAQQQALVLMRNLEYKRRLYINLIE